MSTAVKLTPATNENGLKAQIRAEMSRLHMSQNRLAKESGIGTARLSQWFSDKYAGNTELIEQELTRWLNAVQQRDNGVRRLAAPEWELTPTAQNILTALRFAQNTGDIALVYGGAGLGKTCTAKRYQEDAPNVWIATMSPAMNTVAAVLERVAFSVGLMVAEASASKTENAIVAKIEGTGGLLVIDEAQHLAVSGLDAVRSIHDATGIGLALLGNESVYARITGGSRQAHFAQLFSRVGYRVHLSTPTIGDVEALIAAWGVTDKASKKLCFEIAKQAGAMRELNKSLSLAVTMLDEGETVPTAEHIKAAHAMRGGAI